MAARTVERRAPGSIQGWRSPTDFATQERQSTVELGINLAQRVDSMKLVDRKAESTQNREQQKGYP